ncbi:MAG: DUF2147 domain-containing protein [Hyphomicrobiaceae bacterium]
MLSLARLMIPALAVLTVAVPAFAADPYGTFKRPSTGTEVEFYDCGGKLCAKIVKVTDAAKQSTVGTVIMGGAEQDAAQVWKGDLLNTEDGKTYSGIVTLVDDSHVKLEGCGLWGMICKGETWEKVTTDATASTTAPATETQQ